MWQILAGNLCSAQDLCFRFEFVAQKQRSVLQERLLQNRPLRCNASSSLSLFGVIDRGDFLLALPQ